MSLETGLRRRMYKLLSEFAEYTGRYPDEAISEFKEHLVKIGMIRNSTKELDIKGLAIAGNIIELWNYKEKNKNDKSI